MLCSGYHLFPFVIIITRKKKVTLPTFLVKRKKLVDSYFFNFAFVCMIEGWQCTIGQYSMCSIKFNVFACMYLYYTSPSI